VQSIWIAKGPPLSFPAASLPSSTASVAASVAPSLDGAEASGLPSAVVCEASFVAPVVAPELDEPQPSVVDPSVTTITRANCSLACVWTPQALVDSENRRCS
jgi:hypothetical protein